MRIACIYPAAPGIGGLGVQADNVLASLAMVDGSEVHALGPAADAAARCRTAPNIAWLPAPAPWFHVARSIPGLRARSGALTLKHATFFGRWAASKLDELSIDLCVTFTQVGLESLGWCARHGIPSILESPNGHIRNFRRVYVEEQAAWCGGSYLGHPAEAMVARVEREYTLARRVRVSSAWAKHSLAEGGVPSDRIRHLEQPIDLARYRPGEREPAGDRPLRLCFVGSLDLRKGFVYLLEALARLDPAAFSLEIVGATGDRCSRRLLAARLPAKALCAAGDPRPAYARADLFVLPTLEDGSPFAVAEAMASALPVIVTRDSGAAEWVQPGTGWVVPPRDAAALRRALLEAHDRRAELPGMGRRAREATETRAGEHCYPALAEWVETIANASRPNVN